MNLDGVDVFVEVVDAQSFTRAATRLGMPPTTVSAKIARLEERLGVTLIQRTTRQMRVTPAGSSYYARCVRALAEIAEGERELAHAVQDVSGLIRITAPADLVDAVLTPIVEKFLEAYPGASVDMIVTNRHVDLIAEDVDLAFRAGPLKDSTLVVRKFLSGRLGLWSSPKYLERFGIPDKPSDLVDHALLKLSSMRGIALKSKQGDAIDLELPCRVTTDDFSNLKTMIQRGNGIGVLVDFIANASTLAVPLVRVLPEYQSEVASICFAYPAQRFVPKIVKAFVEMAASHTQLSEPNL